MQIPLNVVSAVLWAGRSAVLEQKKNVFYTKTAGDIVSYIDHNVNRIVTKAIRDYQHLYKTECRIVSEETVEVAFSVPAGPGVLTWYVDPIDGTANLGKNDMWSISIGVQHADDDAPFGGIVYFPMKEWLFFVWDGKPVRVDSVDMASWPHGVKQALFDIDKGAAESTYCRQPPMVVHVGLPDASKPAELLDASLDLMRRVVNDERFARTTGCLSYDIACLALGHADEVFNNHAQIWDFYGMWACAQTLIDQDLAYVAKSDTTGLWTVILV